MLNWIDLTDEAQLAEISQTSAQTPCLIFKHSTRCSISQMAKNRLERQWELSENALRPYYLDLLQYRHISNQVADVFRVHHESPQVLLIVNGECIYDESHQAISAAEIAEVLTTASLT